MTYLLNLIYEYGEFLPYSYSSTLNIFYQPYICSVLTLLAYFGS